MVGRPEPARYGRRQMLNRRQLISTGAGILAAPFVLGIARARAADYTFRLHHLLGPKAPAQTQMLAPWARGSRRRRAGA